MNMVGPLHGGFKSGCAATNGLIRRAYRHVSANCPPLGVTIDPRFAPAVQKTPANKGSLSPRIGAASQHSVRRFSNQMISGPTCVSVTP
jgi:hypothetical protein